MANCSTISLGAKREDEEWDSLEAIIKNAAYTIAKCAAYRQGVGIDFSRLRPNGCKVLNSANQSTGAVHWMEFEDKLGYFVGQCLHPNIKILTNDGYKSIDEIVNTRYNGYVFGKNKMVRVINWFKNPKKLLFRMNLEYGDYIDASKDHKILVYDMEHDCHVETPLRDISIGDYIICRRHRINSACEPIKILPFTYILNEHNNSNRLFIPNKIPTHLTEELAYILGIIYGDGCVYDDAIEIAFSNSWPEIMEKFDNAMFEAFGHRVGEYGIRAKVGEKHTSQGDCTKVFLGKWFCSFFKHIRCLKNKSDNLGFPKIMENCNQSILESFFAGLFDSDGYNSMDKRNVCLSLIDSNFVSILKDNLQKFGYVIKVRKKERPGYCPCYNLSFVGLTSLKILSEIPSIKIQAGNLYGKYDRLKTPYRCKSIGLNPNLYTDINGDDPLSDTKSH